MASVPALLALMPALLALVPGLLALVPGLLALVLDGADPLIQSGAPACVQEQA